MQLSVEDLLAQIDQHHLLPSKELDAVRARWFRGGRTDVHDPGRFCDWLRVNNYLTDFVLTALTRGQADHLTLDQYRLTDQVRSGPDAGDFLAADPLDRTLRIRILSPAVTQDAGRFEKFRQALQRVLNVKHPGVARVLDLGHARGAHYLVSEHVEGESLESLLQKRGKLPYDLAARIFAFLLDAVAALHQNGVGAGELTAGSLVLASAGKGTGGTRTIRLVDFGFPRRFFDPAALGLLYQKPVSAESGAAKVRDEDFDFEAAVRPAEDVLRLGVIFYRCVTGQEPYPAGAFPRRGRQPAPVHQAAPEVPGMLADLIDSMIDPTANNRPDNPAVLAKSLRVFLKAEEDERQSPVEEKIALPTAATPAAADGEARDQTDRLAVDDGLTEGHPGEPEIGKYFRAVMKHQGSDLHLAVGKPPMMRLKNLIREMDVPPLTQADMERLVAPILTPRTQGILDTTGGVDFAYIVGHNEGRYRVNMFRQRGHLGLIARRVNSDIPTFEKLGLPPVLEKLCLFDQGMVIIAGVTGSGKSTTLAAMLDYINEREQVHILTIEDPIEYLFIGKKAVVNQREVGIDVADWPVALKHAVRQDPDVILVGEMRDRETFEAGLHAAETGHLVFCTIHASSAPSTIGRILDLFPADMHPAMRQSLGFNLKAIVCQKLLPSLRPGVQRVPTNEIMIMNPTIRELILKGEDKKLPDALRIGLLEGMMEFNESLRQLVGRGDVTQEAALEASPNPEALKMAFKGIRVAQPGIL